MSQNSDDARVFTVDSRFQNLARRPGGPPREQALDDAKAQIDEITPDLEGWLDAEVRDFAGYIENAGGGERQADWIEIANGRSRQLRDIGGTLRQPLLSYIADSLCELLDSIAAGGEFSMASIECHVDALLLSRQDQYRHIDPSDVPELTKGLRQVAKQASP
jgi:hypothetical protein